MIPTFSTRSVPAVPAPPGDSSPPALVHLPAPRDVSSRRRLDPRRALSCRGPCRARAGLSKVAEDAFLDLVQALDESKNSIAMFTDPVFASVANAVDQLDNILRIPNPTDLAGMVFILFTIFISSSLNN